MTWQDNAECSTVDPELWFPEKGGSPSVAKFICADCPVRTQCLEYAVENSINYGIWGGLSVKERRPLRRGIHGTVAGYEQHLADGETACARCRGAMGPAFRAARAVAA